MIAKFVPAAAVAAVLALSATSASAGSKYGTAEQAQDLATQLIDIIDSGGIEAGVAAVHDQSGPFQATNMGVHIFADSVIMADSRDPELETVSYAGVADLNGVDFWEGMVTAANGNQNFETRWYDYDDDTQEYTYNCHSQWQTEGSVMVWICR